MGTEVEMTVMPGATVRLTTAKFDIFDPLAAAAAAAFSRASRNAAEMRTRTSVVAFCF